MVRRARRQVAQAEAVRHNQRNRIGAGAVSCRRAPFHRRVRRLVRVPDNRGIRRVCPGHADRADDRRRVQRRLRRQRNKFDRALPSPVPGFSLNARTLAQHVGAPRNGVSHYPRCATDAGGISYRRLLRCVQDTVTVLHRDAFRADGVIRAARHGEVAANPGQIIRRHVYNPYVRRARCLDLVRRQDDFVCLSVDFNHYAQAHGQDSKESRLHNSPGGLRISTANTVSQAHSAEANTHDPIILFQNKSAIQSSTDFNRQKYGQ